MTIDFDTRMRVASNSLLRASERLSPAGGPPRSLRPLAVAVAAVVSVVALAAGAVVLRAGDDRRNDVSTDSSGVPRLIPGARAVPDGLLPASTIDLPTDETAGFGTMAVEVYGDPDADEPFAAADLAIILSEQEDFVLPDEEAVTVRGRPGSASDDALPGSNVVWEEEPGLVVSLSSHTLGRNEVLEIAAELTVEGQTVALGPLPADLPAPLEQVGSMPDLSLGASTPLPASARGHVISYQDESGGAAALVAAFAGDASDLGVIQWMTQADTSADVRGHRGWAGSYTVAESSADSGSQAGDSLSSDPPGQDLTADSPAVAVATVIWEESPGVLVVVQGFGLDEDDVRAIAESLRPASDEEWQAALGRSRSDDNSASGAASSVDVPDDALAQMAGEYSGGSWVVYLDAGGTLCADYEAASVAGGACGGADRALVLTDDEGHPVVVYGVMPEGALRTMTTTGNVQSSQFTESTDGRTIYALVIENDAVPTEVIFVGPDGEELATAPVGP